MADYLDFAVTFLDPRFHGRGDGGEPEWPPSPLRLLQAIVAANADTIGDGGDLDEALAWLESQAPPLIVAPAGEEAVPYCLSVPNNAMDIVGRAWSRGKYFSRGDANPATHRTMKTVRPIRMLDGDTIHYLWKLDESSRDNNLLVESLRKAAARLVALGWGIDLVVGCAKRRTSPDLRSLRGERWLPTAATNVAALRTPVSGTIAALQERHELFLHRLAGSGFAPVAPLTRFQIMGYRRPHDPRVRPFAIFELRNDDGSFCRYPQRKLMHIAGMVRHLAKDSMLRSPPSDVGEDWIERYVVGHRNDHTLAHRQFSYVPLPSIGHEYADQAVRRVMVAAPLGDDPWLEHLANFLNGRVLKPETDEEFGALGPPALVRMYRDKVGRQYTNAANRWASVTPVVLPGHDDRKPAKTRKLIEAALAQSGIDQQCTFSWGAVSCFRRSLSAHKYQNEPGTGEKRWRFKNVRQYLRNKTWIHLTLTFDDGVKVPGPLLVGAGRHCGFGLMAGVDN